MYMTEIISTLYKKGEKVENPIDLFIVLVVLEAHIAMTPVAWPIGVFLLGTHSERLWGL